MKGDSEKPEGTILEEFQKRRPSNPDEAYRVNIELKERLAKVVAQYSNGTSPR